MAARSAPLAVLVLAAGEGKRMRSRRPKLLHEVAGRPMVAHVLLAARTLAGARLITIVGHQADQMRESLTGLSDAFVLQRQQRGTAHAVLQAAREVRAMSARTVLIVNGDLPTIRPATLRALVTKHHKSGAALTLLTAEVPDPAGYGRIVRDERGRVSEIVEDRDADARQKRIREINCGVYCGEAEKLLRVLGRLRPDNAQGELYLTDAVRQLLRRGEPVVAVRHAEAQEVLGVNDRAELTQAATTLYARKAAELQRSGVTLVAPEQTWIDPRARVGKDSLLYPGVILEGETVLGEECVVRPGCRIVDSKLGRRVEVKDHSVVLDSRVGDDAAIGPFAHLRPGSVLEREVKVGNFVEVKKATIGRGTKASHLSYLGDATIGEGCNIGAGTITCNYDGEKKHLTRLGRGVFIGSDTQLVAPVTLGDNAYVGAGTTVTDDVPAGSLALSRVRQRNVKGWADKRRRRKKG